MSLVTEVAAAPHALALAHFASLLQFETDCWDVHHSLNCGNPDFVLLDVRGAAHFAAGHIPGATHLPHGKIIAAKLAHYPAGTVFVTYCAGPHCNGAARGAIRLARLGRPVKIMSGGITGWIDEGFALTAAGATASPRASGAGAESSSQQRCPAVPPDSCRAISARA